MRRTWAMLIGLAASAATGPATAAVNDAMLCGDHREIAQRLASEYGEVRHGMGMVGNGRTMEVFISPERGSWTILITHTGGPTCIVAAGEAGEFIPVRATRPAS